MFVESSHAGAGVAALFQKHKSGDRDVFDGLLAAVLEDIRRVAREHGTRGDRPPGPLSNLYFRVAADAAVPAPDVPAFLIVCGAAMRRAVVDYMSRKREEVAGADLVVDIDAALAAVEAVNARLVRVIECRYFAGLTEDEAARAMQMDVATLRREWTRGRAWTLRQLAARSETATQGAIANGAWVDAVFDDALALPEGSLEAFLERCAAAPGELRARVEELLGFASASKPRLEPGDLSADFLWPILTNVEAPAVPVTPVGWRVVRELSRGRLGPLYLAERADGSPAKGVLRYLPSWAKDLTALRVRPDWRALTSLTHESIARIIDAGHADDGRLFVVSELVEGRPLDRYCDEELLTIEQRLDLFVQVCLAVQHAHRRLAVHGGIKPSNVVVSEGGRVTLLDFGMTGLLAPVPLSETSDDVPPWVPSPEYASPEQVRGEPLAVASDVYQLGLLLYLLLTGEHAQTVAGSSTAALRQAVCAVLPAPPSERVTRSPEKTAALRRVHPGTLVRKLRGDMDAIVMYALRKEPDRRYPSVSLLHSDAQRWAKRMPIWAHSGRWRYRFRKFVERRRTAVAAAAVLVLFGAATVPAPVIERLRASRETARVAEVEQLLGDIFAAPAGRGVKPPNALQYVEQAERVARAELAAQPASQSRLFTDIGNAYGSLGHYQRSIAILEEALALRRAQFGDDSLEVASTLEALGRSQHESGRYDEGESNLRTAVAVRQVRLGAAHPETMGATIELGDLLYSRGQFLEAEQVLRGVVGALRPEIVDAAADAPVNELLPRALRNLANVLRDRGAVGESAGLYREAVAILRQTPPEQGSPMALTQMDLSRALTIGVELDRAETEITEALSALRRAHPGDHPLIGLALCDYGALRIEQGRFDEAHGLLTEAQRVQEQWLGRVHPSVPRTQALLAELARRRGELPEAVRLAKSALEDFSNMGMPDHPWTIDIRVTLADTLIALGQHDDAVRVLNRALTSARRLLVSYDPRTGRLEELLLRATGSTP